MGGMGIAVSYRIGNVNGGRNNVIMVSTLLCVSVRLPGGKDFFCLGGYPSVCPSVWDAALKMEKREGEGAPLRGSAPKGQVWERWEGR